MSIGMSSWTSLQSKKVRVTLHYMLESMKSEDHMNSKSNRCTSLDIEIIICA